MIATLTQSQNIELGLTVFFSLLWFLVWCQIWFMLGRMLRWKYLEMKAAHKGSKRRTPGPMAPPAPVWVP